MARRKADFEAIRSEGGLLPPDLLHRVLNPSDKLPGTKPEDYGLPPGERLNEYITQSWNRLRKHWADFRKVTAELPEDEPGTGLTNERWSLPMLRELGFGVLATVAGPELDGRTYAISRFSGPVPIHLVGCNLSLDRRAAGVRGAAATNPHALVQEYLNRCDESLWGIASNGRQLRILRDNHALSRQSYLEFDLEAIFEGELFGDFVLVWLMGHATRFVPREEGRHEKCWLEEWTKIAEEQGTRALGELRVGVEKALQILGEGFSSHPNNIDLRDDLRSGALALTDFHSQLLRLVYRFIFLFVAEDRTLDGQSLLHPIDDSQEGRTARKRYATYYSTSRLREMAGRIKGSRHSDLWRQFKILVPALFGDETKEASAAREQLALPSLGSFLWNPISTNALNKAELSNYDFLETFRHLAFTRQGKVLRPVDYKNLGAEELGGVYESLLALTPQLGGDGQRFTFAEFAGSERKTTGSYYTPDSLVQCLLDSALDPVVEQALKGKSGAEAEEAILTLKVCDPAVGSGHFLVGAAHRLAQHLARVRAHAHGDSEPTALAHQQALRDVIGRCLYGVDINPMAAELCRVGLWLEAMEPGKPLSFLEHHIKVGNSLLGATPALLRDGIPDDAFKPIEGDDKNFIKEWKKHNKEERKGHRGLFQKLAAPWERLGDLAPSLVSLEDVSDDTIEGQRRKRQIYQDFINSSSYEFTRLWADAWCAAFVWIKREQEHLPYPMTEEVFRRIEESPHNVSPAIKDEVRRLAEQYQFFHWHIEFPDVFWNAEPGHEAENRKTGWSGGFDCVLGNPPWEHTELKEKEWFAEKQPDIASARIGTQRKQMIDDLEEKNPGLYKAFFQVKRDHEGPSHFFRNSNRYPLCGRGRINLYAIFSESMRSLLNPSGIMGCIVPTGIATDDTTKLFFKDITQSRSVKSIYGFENEDFLFPSVHHATKFCLLTLISDNFPFSSDSKYVFFARKIEHLFDGKRVFSLSPDDISLLNPNTHNCPIFRSRQDADLTKAIYRRVPIFIREVRDSQADENQCGVTFKQGLFNMTSDSDKFRTRDELEIEGWHLQDNTFQKEGDECLPLYEAKMFHQYDHRWGTYSGQTDAQANQGTLPLLDAIMHLDPYLLSLPRYWVPSNIVHRVAIKHQREQNYFLAMREVSRATDSRTCIQAIIPFSAVGHKATIILAKDNSCGSLSKLISNLNSFIYDYCCRQKISGISLSFFIVRQLPVLNAMANGFPNWLACILDIDEWIVCRCLELTYTAWDLEDFARDCGWYGPPFRWDEERRFLLSAELDAAFFHLYLPCIPDGQWKPARIADGAVRDETDEEFAKLIRHFPTPRDAVDYIMETFPIVKKKDLEAHGHYRTKDAILEIYDAMTEAMRTGQPYQTCLDPPPGPPVDAEGNFLPVEQLDRANWPLHIHLPKDDVLSQPEAVSPVEFAAVTYPSTDTDRAICAVALAIVEQTGGLSSMDHLDALLMATHTDWCKSFLPQADQESFLTIIGSDPRHLIVDEDVEIGWKESRDYLEQLQAFSVNHVDLKQTITLGKDYASAKSTLPPGTDQIVIYAIKALNRITELRKDLTAATQRQARILETLDNQHELYQLAAR